MKKFRSSARAGLRASMLLSLIATFAYTDLAVACQEGCAVSVSGAWLRRPAPGAGAAAGYLNLDSADSKAHRLAAVRSEAAAHASLHTMATEQGVMRMREVKDSLPIPADATLSLKPGGAHLMLESVSAEALAKGVVPVRLLIDNGCQVDLDLPVRDDGPPAHHHH